MTARHPERGDGRPDGDERFAGERSGRARHHPGSHLTSRAAILAVVVCAITLSLAYPVREYVAQRREISALEVQHRDVARHVRALERQKKRLGDSNYVEQEARRRLHYCFPHERCYIVLRHRHGTRHERSAGHGHARPWFSSLWSSIRAADADSSAG